MDRRQSLSTGPDRARARRALARRAARRIAVVIRPLNPLALLAGSLLWAAAGMSALVPRGVASHALRTDVAQRAQWMDIT